MLPAEFVSEIFARVRETIFRYSQRLTATDVLRDMWVPDTATDAVRLRYGASARARPWDVAAGALTITEAGGQVTNLDGSALDLDARKNLASNGKLHRAMRETIAKAWPEADRRDAGGRASP